MALRCIRGTFESLHPSEWLYRIIIVYTRDRKRKQQTARCEELALQEAMDLS
jgi:DNA-directed RNA polymerase specialized sigma24 family protein